MGELGSEQIFARSPQAKGRVERMNGTFQDRLVSELRLAGASTLKQANAVLRDFLPRFNNQFCVAAQQSQVAYRSLASSLHLERILCFKHLRQVARDNTVKYQLRTLQLLPAQNRPSYAGVKVEVQEQSDGQLMVQHEGKVIAHQEAPPKAGALRAAQGALAPTPELAQVVRNLSRHGLTKLQLQRLAAMVIAAVMPNCWDAASGEATRTPSPNAVVSAEPSSADPVVESVSIAALSGSRSRVYSSQ